MPPSRQPRLAKPKALSRSKITPAHFAFLVFEAIECFIKPFARNFGKAFGTKAGELLARALFFAFLAFLAKCFK